MQIPNSDQPRHLDCTAPSASVARSDDLGCPAPALASIFAQTRGMTPSPSVVLLTSPSISAATLNVAPSVQPSFPILAPSGVITPATSSTSSTSGSTPSRPRTAFAGFFVKMAARRSAPTAYRTDVLSMPPSSSTPSSSRPLVRSSRHSGNSADTTTPPSSALL